MPDQPDSRLPIAGSINKRLFLTGMPGAGKTYWGNQLSRALNWNFIDLDNYISLKEKASISALFASYGEKGFRDREQKYLSDIINGVDLPLVIACGGGTPCFFNNMEVMKKNGIVVYLDLPVDDLVKRLNSSVEVRPMLKGRGDLPAYLTRMHKERKAFYELAHHILQPEFISITTFEKIIK